MTVERAVRATDVREQASLILVEVQVGGGLAVEDASGFLLQSGQLAKLGEQSFEPIEGGGSGGGVFHGREVALIRRIL